jgi:hypothetical protein
MVGTSRRCKTARVHQHTARSRALRCLTLRLRRRLAWEPAFHYYVPGGPGWTRTNDPRLIKTVL